MIASTEGTAPLESVDSVVGGSGMVEERGRSEDNDDDGSANLVGRNSIAGASVPAIVKLVGICTTWTRMLVQALR